MNLKSKVLLATVIAPAFASGAAFAAEPGFYIGGSAGQSSLETSRSNVPVGGLLPNRSFDIDGEETGWKAYAGYTFVPWFSLEGGYVELGSPSEDYTVGNTRIDLDAKASGFEGFAVLSLPMGPFEVFGKVGGFTGKVDFDLKTRPVGASNPTLHISEDSDYGDLSLAYGGGVALNFGHWSIRAEYEEYDVDHIDDLNLISAGLVYRFGSKPAPVAVAAPEPEPAPAPAPEPIVAAKCSDADMDGVCDSDDACPNTPSGARVGPAGCDCDYVLRTHFAFDSAELTEQDKADLDALATTLLNPKLNFVAGEIHGHTDSVGDSEYNVKLSKRRADAVASYLQAKGVSMGDRFATQGMGEDKPRADNSTKEGRAENRRVSIHRTDCGPVTAN